PSVGLNATRTAWPIRIAQGSDSTTDPSCSLVESRPPLPLQGGRRPQGGCTLAVDQAESRGLANARAVRSSLLGSQPSAGAGAVRRRGPHLLCSPSEPSTAGIGGEAADHPRTETFPRGRRPHVLYQIPLIRTRGPIGAVRWT